MTVYERGGDGTAWSDSDLTDWTTNVVDNMSIASGLSSSGGNNGYWCRKAVSINPAARITITATWNTGSSTGRSGGYNYLSFGNVELRAYGQDQKGTIVINGEEIELTNVRTDVRDDRDWTVSLTITQATGEVSYTVTPPSGVKSGTGNAGVLGFSTIEMGYVKVGSLSSTHQTLKAISISQETYAYTVSASGSVSKTIAAGSDGPGATVTTPYHRYMLDGTTLHQAAAQGSNPHYGKAFTLDEDNKAITIEYASAATDVALFREAEDFLTPVNDNNYVYIRCSGTQGGYASVYTNVATLPAGAYKMWAASYAKGTDYIFRVGESEVWRHTSSAGGAWTETNSGILQFATADALQVMGGKAQYPLDYVYVQRVFAFEESSSSRTKGQTEKPNLINPNSYPVTYTSSNTQVATVSASGDVTFLHNGTAVITARATIDAVEYYTQHTVVITGEALATENWNTSVANQETYTLSGTGFVNQICDGTTISMAYGSDTETQTVDDGHAHCIDAAGYFHAFLNGAGLPVMGTYYAFTPKINGTLTINALVSIDGTKGRNGIRLIDSDGNMIEKIPSASVVDADTYNNYPFNTLLMAGKTYYVLAETDAMADRDNTAYSTLWLHGFTFAKMDGTTISLIDQSLLFTPNNNANSSRLNRTIPGFDITFAGRDGAKYQNNGTFVFRNNMTDSEDDNGSITITPRIKTGNSTDVKIESVKLNIGARIEGSPSIYINGVDKGSVTANSTPTYSDLTENSLTIKLKGKGESNNISFLLNSLTITYSLSNGATLDLTPKSDYVKLKFAKDYIYDYVGETPSCDLYFDTPAAFYGDVTLNYSNPAFGNACENAVTKHKNSDEKIHFNDGDTNNPYKVRIGQGMSLLTASFVGTEYFASSTATTRLYSRDYEEKRDYVLNAGDSYTVPAASGLSFAITTSGGTITLIGTNGTPDGALVEDERFLTTASGDAVTIKNTGVSAITIKKIEVYRKQGTLDFGYAGLVGADNDVAFGSEHYLPTAFTLTGEDGIADKYETTGTYTITQALTGVSVNATTGELSVGSEVEKGLVQVTLTVNPKDEYKTDYAPVSATVTLKVTDGMWDFRTYSVYEHGTLYNSDGWSGQSNGYYASRDNADFAYILCNDGTPLPRALGLQSMGKHRILHSNKGYFHLQGKGTGASESPNGGGQLLVPAKAGMLVEVNAYSEDILSEMEMEGVTTLDGTDVTFFYVDPSPAVSQYFLAKEDGYIIIKNPSFNLDLHVCYVKVSADMAFKYGNETYIDAQVGTWENPVMNQGTTTIDYVLTNTKSIPGSINATTGEVSIVSGQYGEFNVTATGSGTGLLAGKTGTYKVNVIGLGLVDATHTLAEGGSFDLRDNITTYKNTSGADDTSLKDLVTFTLVEPSPTVSLSGHTLTVEGVQTVKVKAMLGAIKKEFNCTVTGGTLVGGLNPVIANDATSYTIKFSGGENHQFKLKQMYDAIMGDLKASASSLKFYTGDHVEQATSLTAVSSDTLRIEGFDGIKKGGVIPIYATYEFSSESYEIEGTLTVAYSNHVWHFDHDLIPSLDKWTPKEGEWNAGNSPTYEKPDDAAEFRDSGKDWRMVRKIGGKTNVAMVYYYNHSVEGQNALVIPETEGLHVYSSPSNKQMGVEMTTLEGVPVLTGGNYTAQNLMVLRGGRVTIPKLKKSQWVEVRWTRHKEDMAERVLMENLSDFEGTPITSTYKIGNCFYNLPWSTSTYMFQATDDGDVTFEIADNIYISIQQIELHEPGWNPVSSIVSQLNGYDDISGDPSVLDGKLFKDYTIEDRANAGWTKSTAPKMKWQYVWDDQGSHVVTFLSKQYQNAPNAPQTWDFEIDDQLKQEGAVMTYTGDMDSEATLTYNGGWGKVTITMTSYSQNMKYVANKKSWTITFGQSPRQDYPYTWDFTKYFKDTSDGIGTDSWQAGAGAASTTKTAIYPNYDTQNYTQSYYVEGAQLVSYALRETNNGVLRETDGLGFKLDTDATPDGIPNAGKLSLVMSSTVGSSGLRAADNDNVTWQTGWLSIGAGGHIIVPKPGTDFTDYYIYIHSSVKPSSVSHADDVSEEAGTDVNHAASDGQYKYHFTSNDHAEITFAADAKVYQVAVTNLMKDMTPIGGTGWATEGRGRAIDYTLDSLLTTRPLRAYVIIANVSSDATNPKFSADHSKTTVSIRDRRYVVPAMEGLVLKHVTGPVPSDVYRAPLFVPAVTTAQDASVSFRNNLMRCAPIPDEPYEFLSETVTIDDADEITPGIQDYYGTSFTPYILAKRFMTWSKSGGQLNVPTGFQNREAAAFYRLHLYGNSSGLTDVDGTTPLPDASNLNTLAANKAYLALPTSQLPDPLWTPGSSQPAPPADFVGIQGVSDWMDATQPTDNYHTYTLGGQQVDDQGALPKGIYIRNGQKVIVK